GVVGSEARALTIRGLSKSFGDPNELAHPRVNSAPQRRRSPVEGGSTQTRDTPALRIMVSLTLTAVPIFVIQLVLGKPRLLLAIAFYLSLCGFKFQRFVRMFSASHLEAHRRQGYFSQKCDKVFGRYLEFFLGYF